MYRNFGIVLLAVFLALSCKTQKPVEGPKKPASIARDPGTGGGDGVIENSRGYKAEEGVSLKEPPDWVKNGETEPEPPGPYYFQGKAEGNSLAAASQDAETDVKVNIASFILAETPFEADLSPSKQRTVQQKNPDKPGSPEEFRYAEDWIQSPASFSSVKFEDYFWERVRIKNTETIKYWVRYSITDKAVENARRDLKNHNTELLQTRETQEFNALKRRLNRTIADLDQLSFIEEETNYRRKYEELLAIDAEWQEFASRQSPAGYDEKTRELNTAIRLYDPTNSGERIKQEQERLRIEREITNNERAILEELSLLDDRYRDAGGDDPAAPPRLTAVPVGSSRVQISGLIRNSEFLAFLEDIGRPDLFARNQTKIAPAVNISWLDAVYYCNWLSGRSGFDRYYSIKGNSVQINPGRNGYRLPTKEELTAGLGRRVISQADLTIIGILSAESNRAYCFDPKTKGLRTIDGAFPAGNIGCMVVKNER
ncbi:MAG: formylglycine-generating enzyme family protein [Spirochaetaceae bacterium]|jgi:hypothetical protein|nr:formylglycine-generating enzyme family protein [Spirochaetaceae bacterium]